MKITKVILEKAKQNPLAVGAIILVIVIAIMGYQCGVSKEAMRTAKIFEKQAEDAREKADKTTKEKEAENEKLRKDSLEKDKVITKTKAENVVLVRKRAEDKRLMEELKGEIAKERPVELVDRARAVLGTDEVWWNQETERAELSLLAFRNGVTKWAEWEDFTLKREPDYKKEIANFAIIVFGLEGKIANLGTEVGNLKVVIKTKDESYGSLRGAFDDYKRAVGKKPGLLEKAFWSALGYAFGATFGN
jgi:uncharacterized protein YpmB